MDEIYKKLGEKLFKYVKLTKNGFAFWNYVKFIFEYKKEIKNLYKETLESIKKDIDDLDDESLYHAFEILESFEKYGFKGRGAKNFEKIKNKVYTLNNVEMSDKYAFEPIKNRVCYCLSHSLPYRGDGYATRSRYMASAMKDAGFDVIAVTHPGFPWYDKSIKPVSNVPDDEIVDNIHYRRQHTDKKNLKSADSVKILKEVWKKTFCELKPEYVMAASNHYQATPAITAAKELGIPCYYEIRGLWEITRISKNPAYKNNLMYYFEKYYEAKLCNIADGVFTLTTALKEELIKRGVDDSKIYLTPNCANSAMFCSQERDKDLAKKLNIPDDVIVIGYLGTIQMYEGLDDLIQAASILKKKSMDFRLLFVGGASSIDKKNYDQYLKTQAKKYGISDKLIMPGRVSPNEAPKYYSLMDITPFGRKPLPVCEMVSPIKPLEAMAMEKTVIVSDLDALKEIIQNNETGLYFKKGNVESYAETLERAIRDKDLRKRLGQNARKWVEENRQWSKNAELIKNVINI